MPFICPGNRDRLADLPPAGKIPSVREPAALPRFDGLHTAIASVQEDAFAVRLVEQRETVSVLAETRVPPDKLPLREAEKTRQRGNVRVVDFHKTGPAAAVGAALALIVNVFFHGLQRHPARAIGRGAQPQQTGVRLKVGQ